MAVDIPAEAVTVNKCESIQQYESWDSEFIHLR